jgi:DNA-directed RNA polymerase specialized sigma24 family protein
VNPHFGTWLPATSTWFIRQRYGKSAAMRTWPRTWRRLFSCDLAKKAARMPRSVMLGGWLHQATCNVAATLTPAERRRPQRERQAVQKNTLQNDTPGSLDHVAPSLDEAISPLAAEDRTAVLMRFFEKRDFGAVGEALGTSADAAHACKRRSGKTGNTLEATRCHNLHRSGGRIPTLRTLRN